MPRGASASAPSCPANYPGRTRHLHVKVQPKGGRILTTQLYFPGEPGNRRDGLFRRELLIRTAKNEGSLAGRFDFVLDMRLEPLASNRAGERGMAEAQAQQAQAQKAFPVSWDQFHRDARALAWRLSGAGPFEAIVCVTRGGLVPAAIVARELEIRLIETVCVASYHDYKTQGAASVLKGVADEHREGRRRRRQGRADRR